MSLEGGKKLNLHFSTLPSFVLVDALVNLNEIIEFLEFIIFLWDSIFVESSA